MKHYTWTLLFALVTACSPVEVGGNGGSDAGNGGDDGGGGDGGGGSDAGPGLVTARVLNQAVMPLPGAKVAFSKADGSLISVKTTDANGEASETMDAGGMVSAGLVIPSSDGTQYQVMTVVGAMPGDVIEFGPRTKAVTYNQLGSADFRFASDWSNAKSYTAGTGCSNASVPAPQPAGISTTYYFSDDRCSRGQTRYDLLGYAFTDSNQTAVGAWTQILDVQANNPGTYASEAWNANFDQLNAFMTKLPFDAKVELSAQMLHNGVTYEPSGYNRQVSVSAGGNAAYAIPMPSGFSTKTLLDFSANSNDGTHFIGYAEMRDANNSTLTVDTSTLGYPQINDVTLDTSVAGRPAVTFNPDGAPPESAEATLAFTNWFDPSGGSTDVWQWIVIAPPGAKSPLRAPALPNDFVVDPSGALPRWPAPPNLSVGALVAGMLEIGDLNGWDEVRTKRGMSIVGDDSSLGVDAPVGAKSIISAGGIVPN